MRRYDNQRAQCEDSEVIRGWFAFIQNTIAKYRILFEDIYNFDEIGFMMGIIFNATIVTSSDRSEKVKIKQFSNRK